MASTTKKLKVRRKPKKEVWKKVAKQTRNYG